ncbi:MAG: hypothetical protein A2Z06_01340 [Candidatus Glassbacteria bacterium RBG_16_58_8]|uniref:Uncharacterized protein n=1 Tax=Candidatus Glassbacteria bacterium RBG_16_58_8 TaxID=1817866 RepID=A0A1F5YBS9_9BACT|nr:MAG: hypothetical protein A2Z06_01340 [Candidatus Glassbacteria bacterium RBG_16_58_8]
MKEMTDGKIYFGEGRVIVDGRVIDGPEPQTVEERRAIRELGRQQPQAQEAAPAEEAAPFVQDEDDLERIKALEEKDDEFFSIQEALREYATRIPEAEAEKLNRDTKTYLHHYNRIKNIRREVTTETLEGILKERNPDFEGIQRQGSPRPVRQSEEPSPAEQAKYWKGRMSDNTLTPTERSDAEAEYARILFSGGKR